MRYLVLFVFAVSLLYSCKKDTYGYTCRCQEKDTGAADTVYTIVEQTAGQANYRCNDYADTANEYGANIKCNLD